GRSPLPPPSDPRGNTQLAPPRTFYSPPPTPPTPFPRPRTSPPLLLTFTLPSADPYCASRSHARPVTQFPGFVAMTTKTMTLAAACLLIALPGLPTGQPAKQPRPKPPA